GLSEICERGRLPEPPRCGSGQAAPRTRWSARDLHDAPQHGQRPAHHVYGTERPATSPRSLVNRRSWPDTGRTTREPRPLPGMSLAFPSRRHLTGSRPPAPQGTDMSNDTTITVVGNLVADPILKFLPSGRAVA